MLLQFVPVKLRCFKSETVIFYRVWSVNWYCCIEARQETITSLIMIVLLVSVLLLLLALLFLAHHRWENSAYVRTIDLIPGVRRKFLVGNVTDLPKESDGKIKPFSFICTTTWLSRRFWLWMTWGRTLWIFQYNAALCLDIVYDNNGQIIFPVLSI